GARLRDRRRPLRDRDDRLRERAEDQAGADVSAAADGTDTAGVRAIAGAVAWRSIHNFLTNPALLIPSLIFPLFFFASFAGGLSATGEAPGFESPAGSPAFQSVFVLLQSASFGGVFPAFGIARDFESAFARRFLLAASNRSGIVVGYGI